MVKISATFNRLLLYLTQSGLATLLLRGGTSPNPFDQHHAVLEAVWRPKPLRRWYRIPEGI